MTIERRQEFPYPRNLRSLADIEKYLKSLHVALASSQSSLTEIISTEFNTFSEEILGTANQIIVTDNHPTNITLSTPQDIHTGASPTFVTAKLSALTNGYLPYHVSDATGLANSPLFTDGVSTATLRNNTDSAVDPVNKLAVGATPIVKWSRGLRDSDSDNYLWCNTDGLVDTTIGGTGWGTSLIICDYTNNRVKQHLASTLAYSSQVASAGAHRVCTDGTNYYVSDATNHQIRKYLIATNALLWTVGTQGSGDDQFDAPQGLDTDGTYLYIADKENERIKKHLCSTGAYVAKLGSYGTALGQFSSPTGICTDGTWLYITEGSPGAVPLIKKHLCSDLSGVSQISADGHLDDTNCSDICTDGSFLYLINLNSAAANAIFKYTRSLVYVSDYGANGTGDTQFAGPYGICTDKTYLYVTDSGNNRVKQHLLSDYSYVAQTGTDGVGDSNFKSPRGICIGYLGEPRTGRLLRLRQDGSHFEAWPKLDLYNHLLFREDSVLATDYVAIKAPSAITASYTLTLPTATAGAKKHLYTDALDNLGWGQNADTDASPIFVTVKLSGLTDGYVPYHVSDATGLANSPIKTDGTSVGIGADASAVSTLVLGAVAVPQWGGSTLFCWGPTRTVTSNETNYMDGMSFNSYFANIASGITDSGYRSALNLASYIVDTNFKGTLATQYGAYIAYGIAEAGTSGERVVTNSYGLYLSGMDYEGTIANKWGVYQVNANFTNYFEGKVGIGDAAPAEMLDVTGSINVTGGYKIDDVALAAADVGAEPALGNPGVDGYVLSSTTLGVRSWIAAGGALALDDLTDVDAAAPDDHDIIQYHTGVGWVHGALPAGAAHDILSATHGDTTAVAVTRGDIIIGSVAAPNTKWTALAKGTAGYVLTMGADEPAWAANAAGAPTDAKYIVGLANATLSAEKVKPQLYNNYDIDDTPAAPNALDDEFDNSSLDGKWTKVNDPAGANAISETAYPGYVWVGLPEQTGTDNYDSAVRLYQAAPAGNAAATYIAKVCLGISGLESSTDAGEFAAASIYLGNSTDDEFVASAVMYNDGPGDQFSSMCVSQANGVSGTWGNTTFNNYQIVPAAGSFYLKIEKTTNAAYASSNTYNMYYSFNGIVWEHIGQQVKTFTHDVNEVGIMFRLPKAQGGSPVAYGLCDFFRRTV